MKKLHYNMRRPVHGRSLIELMVAILIGSLVLAGVMVITAGSTSIGRRTDSLGGLSDTGQTAAQVLASDVRMAGYSLPRTYFAKGYTTKMLSTAGIRGCDAGFVDSKAPGLNALACTPGVSSSGGALSIAYEADPYNSIYVKNSDGVSVPSDCRGFGLAVLVGGLQGNVSRPEVAQDSMSDTVYWQVENRYYVANSGPDAEPSLMCAGNGGTGNSVYAPQALIRGVERMVISYGVAADATRAGLEASRSETVLDIKDPSVSRYMSADEIDKKWPAEPVEVRWQRVVSVRVCLEIRGATGSAAAATSAEGASYTTCEGTSKSITDFKARRAVRMTINLRNRTMNVDSTTGLGLGGV